MPSSSSLSVKNARNAKSADWSDEEESLLRKLKFQKLTTAQIAAVFRDHGFTRESSSIAIKASRLGVGGRTTGLHVRRCMVCSREFLPEARMIFICTPCKTSDEFSTSGEYYSLAR